MFRNVATLCLFLLLGTGLSGCGQSTGDRAASGGMIGAGAGAALGAVTGTGVVGGALLGGAIGAVGGAATSSRNVDLGRPVWR